MSQNQRKRIRTNVVNLGLEIPQESKLADRTRDKWIHFGSDNLFIHNLAERARNSGTHNSIIANKHTFIIGNGIEVIDEDSRTQDYISLVNGNGESLQNVFNKVALDFVSFGNAYIEVVRTTFGGTTAISLFHKDATTVRVGKPDKNGVIDTFFVSPNWCKIRDKKNKPVAVDAYNRDSRSTNQIIHIKEYSPEFFFYGLPDYIGALKWVEIENRIPSYNLDRFENGFMPSAILDVFGDMGEEEAQDFIKCIKDSFVGQGNNSKLFVNILESQEQKSNLQLINDVSEGTFMQLQTLAVQNIITSHRWRSSLAGIQTQGKLSGGKETRDDFEIVNNTVIKVYQEKLLAPFKRILRDIGLSDELSITTSSPISLTNEVNIADVLTVDEQRRLLGFEPLEIENDLADE